MALRIGRRTVAAGCLAVAVLAAGCDRDAPPRGVETVPPGADVSPPAESPGTPTPKPTASVNPAVACVTAPQVMEALTYADPDTPPSLQSKLGTPPVCAAGWAYTTVTAPNVEENRVVLWHTGGRWQVVTSGSAPCVEPRVADAPKPIRAAAGCP